MIFSLMSSTEIIPGVFHIQGRFTDKLGPISVYLVVSDGKAVLIDSGTAGSPGGMIEKVMDKIGLNSRTDLVAVLCTHAHPDHVGGLHRIMKLSKARVMVHENDVRLLENPSLFLSERLRLNMIEKITARLEKGPLRVNYPGVKVNEILHNNDTISFGSTRLRVIFTGGHSAGHCVFFEPSRKILFSGDEINNFPNEPRMFFTDCSGDLAARVLALDKIKSLHPDYLLPTHDSPHIFEDVIPQIQQAHDSTQEFLGNVLCLLKARGKADIEQIAFDLTRMHNIPIPFDSPILLRATIYSALMTLKRNGIIEQSKSIWSVHDS